MTMRCNWTQARSFLQIVDCLKKSPSLLQIVDCLKKTPSLQSSLCLRHIGEKPRLVIKWKEQ